MGQVPKKAKSRFGLDGLVTSKNTKMTRPPLSSLTLAVNLADEKPKHLLTCASIKVYTRDPYTGFPFENSLLKIKHMRNCYSYSISEPSETPDIIT